MKDVKVDYDYLTELVEQLLNQVHEDKDEEAKERKKNLINSPMGWMIVIMRLRL
ncbi:MULTISPECIES: hypothetical protein [Paenibacillus]|uniref:hypothetical protein n=1 Tax=Paenibacillus TaxID=44249 RepID=UPI0003D3376F|nr:MULTISPECIES: hypothetical protein [Paenibacillus]